MNKIILLFIFLMALLFSSCTFDKEELPEPPPPPPPMSFCDSLNVTYSVTVAPIINANCAISGCHASGSSFGDYTNYAGVKAKVDNGTFKERVIVQKNMPPSGPLPQTELDKLQCWLDKGAPNN